MFTICHAPPHRQQRQCAGVGGADRSCCGATAGPIRQPWRVRRSRVCRFVGRRQDRGLGTSPLIPLVAFHAKNAPCEVAVLYPQQNAEAEKIFIKILAPLVTFQRGHRHTVESFAGLSEGHAECATRGFLHTKVGLHSKKGQTPMRPRWSLDPTWRGRSLPMSLEPSECA
jgi:hypothetical protein